MDDAQLKAALTGASTLTPASSKCPKWAPITIQLLNQLLGELKPKDPPDASIHGAITTIFYTTSHAGKFTVPTLNAFDPKIHITLANISEKIDKNGYKVTAYQLPKCTTNSEEVSCATQDGPANPKENLNNHL